MPQITLKDDDEVLAFITELIPLFGNRRDALRGFIQATPQFRKWRAKVGQCEICNRFVPLSRNPRHGFCCFESHHRRNPDGDRPYHVECGGSLTPAKRWKEIPGLDANWAHIEHRIETVQPGLL